MNTFHRSTITHIDVDFRERTVTLRDDSIVVARYRTKGAAMNLDMNAKSSSCYRRPKVEVAVRDLRYYNQLLKRRPIPEAKT